jgi:hypothetical protein
MKQTIVVLALTVVDEQPYKNMNIPFSVVPHNLSYRRSDETPNQSMILPRTLKLQ